MPSLNGIDIPLRHPGGTVRVTAAAIGFGLLAGAFAALALRAMNWLQEVVWGMGAGPWYTLAAILLGAVLIALLERWTGAASTGLEAQIAEIHGISPLRRRRTALVALSAIVAIGFGGAIGPEAGLVAIVAELSALVGARLTRVRARQRTIARWGTAAALSGLYSSPAGASAYEDDGLTPAKGHLIVAGIAGFVGFLLIHRVTGDGHGLAVELPPRLSPLDGRDALLALGPAALAALLAFAYLRARGLLQRLTGRWLRPRMARTLVLSALFALLAIAQPLVRFSGHHDFSHLAELSADGQHAELFTLSVLKLLACALCLVAGWRGGDAFPLMTAGAAAGLSLIAFVPELHPTVAIVSGMAAALAVGLARPLAALLIVIFLTAGNGLGAVFAGAAVGLLAVRLLGLAPGSHGPASHTDEGNGPAPKREEGHAV